MGLAFTFFMSFEGSSYWFVYPNRGGIFLRENSNGLKVSHQTVVLMGSFGQSTDGKEMKNSLSLVRVEKSSPSRKMQHSLNSISCKTTCLYVTLER